MHKMFSDFRRYFFIIIVLGNFLYAASLEQKYPSYTYVFNEFDVPQSYVYNEDFIHFVNRYEKNMKRFYQRSLRRGETLLPMMQGQLVEDGVSDLFIYLSMVESGFSTDIVSSKKAVGLWQFMPATARHYDLTVCSNYDERCDAISATSAAIRYLNKLHKQFGKWYLAAMAYNCGEGCVKKAISKAGSDALYILTDKHLKYLPAETRAYIKKILLVAMIGENSLIGLDDTLDSENGFIQVEIARDTSIKEIAKLIKMKPSDLLKLNTAFKDGKLPSDKAIYILNIPIEKMYAFYLRYELPENIVEDATSREKKSEVVSKTHMVTHRVEMGETLESIAKYYDDDIDEIRMMNHLEDESLTLGMLLVLYVSEEKFKNMSK